VGHTRWGAAQVQIRKPVLFLCERKSQAEREEIGEDIVEVVRAIAKGDPPAPQTEPLDREDHAREGWARMVARHLVSAALAATERSPSSGTPPPTPDQQALLREIAKLALWHMRDAPKEARELVRVMQIERLKQAHPGDDLPPE
jgi:hypothetical protein